MRIRPSARTSLLAPAALACLPAALHAQSLLQELPLPSLLPIQAPPSNAVAGDLDGDGDDDLVVVEGFTLVVLRQHAGAFVREPIVGISTFGTLLAIGDFDGDSFPDFASSVPSGGNFTLLRVWWGDGSGQFPTPNPTDVGFNVDFSDGPMRAADMDGDGDIDFVVRGAAFWTPWGATMLRNNGNRTFTQASDSEFPRLSSGSSEPFLVDVDGDGARDVVWVSRDARTRLYWNNSGNFAEATAAQFPLVQQSLRGLALSDVDGDGDGDLVLGGDAGPGLLLRAVGPRQLTLDASPPTGSRVVALVAADEDGDGDADLRVFGRDQDELRHNDGTGAFALVASHGGSQNVRLVVPADLDGDGDVDQLRIGRGEGSSQRWSASIAYAVVPGRFELVGGSRLPITTALVGRAQHGDIDGDGRTDLLISSDEPAGSAAAQTIQFARGTADASFAFRWAQRVHGVNNGFFADLTGDGRDEYVLTFVDPGYLTNTGGELGVTPVPLPVPLAGWTVSGAGADIDGDGDCDLVFAVQIAGYSTLAVHINQGAGAFVDESATRLVGPVASGQYAEVQVLDADADGDDDIWLSSANELQFWRNQNGVLTFVPNAIPITAWGNGAGVRSSVADFDGDGDVDLHVGRLVLLNNGTGMFTPQPLSALPNVNGITLLAHAADFDDDGDVDLLGSGIVVANNGDATFTLANNVLPFGWGTGEGLLHVIDVDLDGAPDAIATPATGLTVLMNRLRHLRVVGASALGGHIELRYAVRPGTTQLPVFAWMVLALSPIAPTYVPGLGWLQLDPASAILVGGQALPAVGGEAVHLEAIPNVPSLLGVLVAAQPLELRGGRLRLGNLVTTLLGR